MQIEKILKKIGIDKLGRYEDQFYIIDFEDSDEAARAYSALDKNAVNTEFPNFEKNTNNTTTKVTNYFEVKVDEEEFNIFLISDYKEDKYYLKIGEKE